MAGSQQRQQSIRRHADENRDSVDLQFSDKTAEMRES
jgi:hypothetical protein